jgi:hypothetical protein
VSVKKDFERRQKQKVLGMLYALIQKIESGEFSITNHGWWLSRLGNGASFKFDVLIRDEEQTHMDFDQF